MTEAALKIYKGMVFAIPLYILLYGCAPDADVIKDDIYKNSQAYFYINNIPFFPQQRYYCGPASLASVMNFYGISVSEQEIAKEIYIPKLNGALGVDMLNYARAKGFNALYYKGNIEEVKKEISSGRPVILFLDLGYSFYPVRHYIVAIGYNDKTGYLIAHSGAEKDKTFSYREIQTAWEKTGFGTILIAPKGQ
ncbi:MAG: C39 family peptidase [Deltaproteobacteria bacterium]|nr:C39 family peptidase [Deltaproteobacteria bacterium]